MIGGHEPGKHAGFLKDDWDLAAGVQSALVPPCKEGFKCPLISSSNG